MHLQFSSVSNYAENWKLISFVVFLFWVIGFWAISTVFEMKNSNLNANNSLPPSQGLTQEGPRDKQATLWGGCPFSQGGEDLGC